MGRTTEKLEERQQSKAHGHKQQGQLDDAGHDLMVNSCVEQHFAHMLNRQVIKVVVGLRRFSSIATINSLNDRDFCGHQDCSLKLKASDCFQQHQYLSSYCYVLPIAPLTVPDLPVAQNLLIASPDVCVEHIKSAG